MTSSPSDWIRLHSDSFTAEIDPQGAQLSVLRDSAGLDLLWNGDATFWNGRAPILFPIVGALNGGHYAWRRDRYALPRHGFARGCRFEVVRNTERAALFRLTSDAATLQVYPFAFELDVAFRLDANALVVEAGVRNTGSEPMPASLGFHPAFRWPLPNGHAREEHYIEFEFAETARVRRLDKSGLLTDDHHPTPVQGRRLALQDALFKDDVLILDHPKSRQLTYGTATGPRLQVSFPNASHLGLWSKPGAEFVCIEPWRGVADPVGFVGSLNDKPGVFRVAQGARQSLVMRIEWRGGTGA
ncbi:MAG: aldose 1-epimerase family protein [Steroidobacteraceae bacterium]